MVVIVEKRMSLCIPDMHLPRPAKSKIRPDDSLSSAEGGELSLIDRVCPKCSFTQPRRLPRSSWMERRFMPYFGLYPWECPLCRIHFYRKNRKDLEERISLGRATEFRSGELGSRELIQ
jgi:hypothetical protein